MESKDDVCDFPTVVDLNVGGVPYTTCLSTLTKDNECLLGRMFSGKAPVVKDTTGRYFIDADGSLFGYILDFLRGRKPIPPESGTLRERLKNEAEIFEMPQLVAQLDEETPPLVRPPAAEMASTSAEGSSRDGLKRGREQCLTLYTESILEYGKFPPSANHSEMNERSSICSHRSVMSGRSPLPIHHPVMRVVSVAGDLSLCREVFASYITPGRYDVHPFREDHITLDKAFEACINAGFGIVATSSHVLSAKQSFNMFHFVRHGCGKTMDASRSLKKIRLNLGKTTCD